MDETMKTQEQLQQAQIDDAKAVLSHFNMAAMILHRLELRDKNFTFTPIGDWAAWGEVIEYLGDLEPEEEEESEASA